MPYLLTANPPGSSPTSWVKMETDSVMSGHSEVSSSGRLQQPQQQQHRPRALPLAAKYSHYVNTNNHSSSSPSSGMMVNGNSSRNNYATYGNNHSPPPMMSPVTSGFSNYSLHRNHLNFNGDPRANSVLSNSPVGNYSHLESPYQSAALHDTLRSGVAAGNSNHRLQQHLIQLQQQQLPQQQQERIEVQILPQDPDWGDNTTAVTGLSDLAFPPDGSNSYKWDDSSSLLDEDGCQFTFQRYIGSWTATVVSLAAFLSPVLMVAIPQMGVIPLRDAQLRCDVDCDGLLISFCVKLLLLLLGSWAVFSRQPKATLPRIHLYRSLICALLVVITFTFWLFFAVRITAGEQRKRLLYFDVVHYATSMVDALLFVHYLAVLLIEIRHSSPEFYIKIVRSPDGESRSYSIGHLSVQRAAVWVLQKYYTDFTIFNPYLERLPIASAASAAAAAATASAKIKRQMPPTNFKYYDVGGMVNPMEKETRLTSPLLLGRGGSKRDSSHNERFYEEHEYERRLRKRRTRLITATEEAFAHLKRLNDERSKTPSSPLECHEAAQAIFPNLARPLQKYLRITRQQPRHTMDSILQQLATSLKYDMAPKAFLEKYLVASPVLQNDRESNRTVQTWSLVCDLLLSRSIREGVVFQLRQGDVSLLCEIRALPHFNITEEIIDAASNKFLLRLNNSETPV